MNETTSFPAVSIPTRENKTAVAGNVLRPLVTDINDYVNCLAGTLREHKCEHPSSSNKGDLQHCLCVVSRNHDSLPFDKIFSIGFLLSRDAV